jgi:hypothetical protein
MRKKLIRGPPSSFATAGPGFESMGSASVIASSERLWFSGSPIFPRKSGRRENLRVEVLGGNSALDVD